MAEFEISTRIETTDEGYHRMKVWVSGTTDDIPSEIFVYRELPPTPDAEWLEMQFVHVAKYEDMLTSQSGEEYEDDVYFRLHWVDLTFNSMAILLEKHARLLKYVQQLVEDIVRINGLDPVSVTEVSF